MEVSIDARSRSEARLEAANVLLAVISLRISEAGAAAAAEEGSQTRRETLSHVPTPVLLYYTLSLYDYRDFFNPSKPFFGVVSVTPSATLTIPKSRNSRGRSEPAQSAYHAVACVMRAVFK